MLFILRGVSGTGKSRIASTMFPSHCILSTDALRMEMYGTMDAEPHHTQMVFPEIHRRLEYRCQYRMITCLDATNLSLKSVKQLTNIAEKWGCDYRITSIYPNMDDAFHTIKSRQMGVIPGALVPDAVLEKQEEKYHKGTEDIKRFYGGDIIHFFEGTMRDCKTYISRTLETINHHVVYGDVYVIGDVHGYIDQLKELLDRIPKNALIYSVGDLIDRGPDSVGTVFELFADPRFRGMVMGNHELAFLKEYIAGMECRSKARAVTHKEVESLPEDTQKYFIKCLKEAKPFIAIESPDTREKAYITHGGVGVVDVYQLNLHATTGDRLNKVCGYDESYPQVHGHMSWQYDSIPSSSSIVNNIDSGIYETGVLTAYNPFTGVVIQTNREGNVV